MKPSAAQREANSRAAYRRGKRTVGSLVKRAQEREAREAADNLARLLAESRARLAQRGGRA